MTDWENVTIKVVLDYLPYEESQYERHEDMGWEPDGLRYEVEMAVRDYFRSFAPAVTVRTVTHEN